MYIKDIKGLTLTELMIVLAIIGIMAAISIPMYISDIPRQKLKGAAQTLLVDLRIARSRAVANNQPYLVCFNAAGSNTYTMGSGPLNTTDCTSLPLDKTMDFSKQYSGVEYGRGSSTKPCPDSTSLLPIDFIGNTARFDTRGSSVDGAGQIWLNGVIYLTNPRDAKGRAFCAHVEGTTGRAKLYRWGNGEWN